MIQSITGISGIEGPTGSLAVIGLALGVGAAGLSLVWALFWVLGTLFGDASQSMPFLPAAFKGTGYIGLMGCGFIFIYSLIERRVRTIALHTWRSAIRFRFFWVMSVLLLMAVVALPLSLKGDGTAEGLTQILITYTLSIAFFFLAAGTLWVSAGTLARDIEESQIQMIVIKPVARWQIWLGKWLGIMAMNFVLLGIVAVSLLGVVEYRAHKLTADEFANLEKKSDLDVFRQAILSGVDVFQRDETTLKLLPSNSSQDLLFRSQDILRNSQVGYEISIFSRDQADSSAQPLIKPMDQIRREVAGLEEKRLREQVLVARAALPLEGVRRMRATLQGPEYKSLDADLAEVAKLALEEIAFEETERMKVMEEMAKRGQTLFPPVKLSVAERAAVSNRVATILRIRSQVIEPGRGLEFQFSKPLGFRLSSDDRLKLKLNVEDPLINYTSSRSYGIAYYYGTETNLANFIDQGMRMVIARNDYEIPMHAYTVNSNKQLRSIFESKDQLYVTVINATHKVGDSGSSPLKVPFMDEIDASIDPGRLQVLYPEAGFTLNLIRSCGILMAWLGILAAMGLVAASFMSFNVSAFACLGFLFVVTVGADTMKSVLKAGTIKNTYTLGQRDSSILDTFAVASFSVLVPVIDTQKEYTPISNLADGQSTTWGQLLKAYAFIWGISGWLLACLGGIIFSRRQLAIHGAQAP